jgi:hypothetical protein
MTSYYFLDCDTIHELGSDASPFVCDVKYSSDEENTDNVVPLATMQAAHHQIYIIINPQMGAEISTGEHTPRANDERRRDGEVATMPTTLSLSLGKSGMRLATP